MRGYWNELHLIFVDVWLNFSLIKNTRLYWWLKFYLIILLVLARMIEQNLRVHFQNPNIMFNNGSMLHCVNIVILVHIPMQRQNIKSSFSIKRCYVKTDVSMVIFFYLIIWMVSLLFMLLYHPSKNFVAFSRSYGIVVLLKWTIWFKIFSCYVHNFYDIFK